MASAVDSGAAASAVASVALASDENNSNVAEAPPADLAAAVQEINAAINSIGDELRAIKDYIVRKDEELQNWQKGYDWAKRKEILGEFANWLDVLERRESVASLSKDARAEAALLRETMEISMENFSLEKIRPLEGDEYSNWRECADVVGAIVTDEKDKDGRIAKVAYSGIQYRTGESKDAANVVRSAKVYIWRYSVADRHTNS